MTSKNEKIKAFYRDLKNISSLEDKLSSFISQKIKERLEEKKRESDVVLHRFKEVTKGKEIILENKRF